MLVYQFPVTGHVGLLPMVVGQYVSKFTTPVTMSRKFENSVHMIYDKDAIPPECIFLGMDLVVITPIFDALIPITDEFAESVVDMIILAFLYVLFKFTVEIVCDGLSLFLGDNVEVPREAMLLCTFVNFD